MIEKILSKCETISISKSRNRFRAHLSGLTYRKGWLYQDNFLEADSIPVLLDMCLEEVNKSYV